MYDNKQKGGIVTPIENAVIDSLIACADGDAALLYLHIARTGSFSLSRASRDLRLKEDEVNRAFDTLRRLGAVELAAPPVSEELPQYTAEDITQRAKTDSTFESIVGEAERQLGKILGRSDLQTLFGIYDHIGLPGEVILLLINHCIEAYRAKAGEGRIPTMRYIEKEAWYWAGQEIITLDAAEEHIAKENLRHTQREQVKSVLQIRGRGLTESETKYIDGWLGMGFGAESIAIAYDRTIMATGKLAWRYMDKIISNWNEKKLYTPEEIQAGEGKYQPRGAAAPSNDKDRADIENMRRMYERMRGGK